MSDKNNIDFLVKSVLGEAREEAPEHIWEGVSAGLDRAARRRAAVLWLGRGVAGAAAAAAIVCGLFFWGGSEEQPVMAEVVQDSVEVMVPGGHLMAEAQEGEMLVPGGGMMTEVREGAAEDRPVEGAGAVKGSVPPAGSGNDEYAEAGTEGESAKETEDEFVPAGSGDMIDVVRHEKTDAGYAESTSEKNVSDEDRLIAEAKEVPSKTGEYFPEDWGEENVRKKKNISLLLSGITGANADVSQKRIGPMRKPGSAAIPTETGIQEISVKSTFGVPLSVGAGVKIDLTPRWALSVGANYTFLSRQFFGTYTEVNEAGVIEVSKQSTIRNYQHYVGIPVNAYYNIINSNIVYFYAYAGGAVERNVSDSYTLMGSDFTYREPAKGVQFSANLGIGVEFMLGKHLGLYLDPSLRYYFNNRQPRSIRTVQPLMFGMEMGLRVKL